MALSHLALQHQWLGHDERVAIFHAQVRRGPVAPSSNGTILQSSSSKPRLVCKSKVRNPWLERQGQQSAYRKKARFDSRKAIPVAYRRFSRDVKGFVFGKALIARADSPLKPGHFLCTVLREEDLLQFMNSKDY